MTSFAVVAGVAVAVAAIYFLSGFGRAPQRKKKVRSVEVGPSVPGQSRARRHPEWTEKLYVPTIDTLYALLKDSATKFANKNAAGSRSLVKIIEEEKVIRGETKKWQYFQLSEYKWLTYAQLFKKVTDFASGLRGLGIKPSDNFAIFEETRLEWTVSAQACFSQSIVVATIYSNLGEEGLQYALVEGEVSALLTNGKLLSTVDKIASNTPSLKSVIFTDEADQKAKAALEGRGIRVISFDEVEKQGAASSVPPTPPKADDLAIIMYTSGSTGNPKGVMISHKNILSTVGAVFNTVHLAADDVYISYLPLAHVLALACEVALIKAGGSFGYANPRSLLDAAVRNCKGDLRELRPTLMAGVPTVWDRVRKGALAKVDAGSPVLKFIFNKAFDYKLKALSEGRATPLVDKVFGKFKETLGGRVRLMVSGGAPLSPDAHKFLRVAFGIPVLQGYGLTETCGGASLQEIDDYSYGCVGTPLCCSEIKLVDVPEMNYLTSQKPPRGEVWIYGSNVTAGYYKNPEKSKEDFQDGWFATGDVGQWNHDGTLSIIDRKKNLVKLSHGEYIALERLESVYKGAPFVESVCVVADSTKPFPIAVVHPSKPALSDWATKNGLDPHDWEDLCENEKAEKAVMDSLLSTGKKAGLKGFELVRSVILGADEWTPENGLMTAAMKLKRQAINEVFKDQIDAHLAQIGE